MSSLIFFADAFPKLWLGLMALLGLIVGSFLNVIIYRIPIMLLARWRHEACLQLSIHTSELSPGYNLCWPPSACPCCQHPIAIKDNIPLVSWLLLRGRSRCCQRQISWRYPVVEVLSALLFMVAANMCSPGVPLLGAVILFSGLLVLAVIDAQTMLLPDMLTLPLLWLGLLFNVGTVFVELEDAVYGAVAGYVSLWLVYWLFQWLTGKEALGYGDFKLLAALGAWLGWQTLPKVVLIAALSGLIVTLLWRRIKPAKREQPLAFGPWLALGGAFVFISQNLS